VPAAILRMILRETVLLVAVGVTAGVAITLAGGKTISSQLYGIKTADVWPIAAAIVVLSSAALLAGFLPARRASRVDPMVALRDE
jgi:ABC-type antimicrobial peptide transport system permease subunit